MRTFTRILLTLGVAGLMAAPVLAQGRGQRGQGGQGGGRGGFGGGVTMLINNKSVQEELKLSEDDVKKAKDAADAVSKKHADDLKGLDPRNNPDDRTKAREINQTIAKESAKAIEEVLKPDQAKRLKEIVLQRSISTTGPAALLGADISSALKLTDDQKDKLKTIGDDFTKEAQQVRTDAGLGGRRGGGGGGTRPDPAKVEEVRKKVQGLSKESMDKAVAMLNPDQKKSLDDLKGKPFELKIEAPRD